MFKSKIQRGYERFKKTIGISKVRRVNVNYLKRIELSVIIF